MDNFLHYIKLSKEQQLTIFLIGLVFIIIAQFNTLLNYLDLNNFIQTSLTYISIITILSFCSFISSPLLNLISFIYRKSIYKRKIISYIKKLTKDEKMLLQKYIIEDISVQYFPISNGVIGSLKNKELVYMNSTIGTYGSTEFAFNIQEIPLEILRKHPEYVDL
jgi:hypothetical protein